MTELYLPRATWLHLTDPRVKLLGVSCSLLVLFVAKNLEFMLAVLLFLHLLYGSAQIPRSNLFTVWKTLLPVSLLVALLWILFYPSGASILQVWMIRVTPMAIAQGLVLSLRIINIGLVVTLWLYTTEASAIVQGLVRLHVPYEWGLVLALALRYIPLVQETYVTISQAQQARGLNLSGGKGVQRARGMLPIFIAMMISVLRSSDHLARALEARGFGGHATKRTTLYELQATRRDYVLTLSILGMTLGFLWLNLYSGFASRSISLF